MASLIDETEGTLGLVIALLVVGLIGWYLFKIAGWFGPNGDSGKAQSVTNAVNGFPDGADPGTVPAAQYLQGIVESIRNFKDYVFGSEEDNEANSAPDAPVVPAPATPGEIQGVGAAVQEYNGWANSNEDLGTSITNWSLSNLF